MFKQSTACTWGIALVVSTIAAPTLAAPAAFRMTDLDLRDPHLYTDIIIFGCIDITDSVPFGNSLNEILEENMNEDGDDDGYLDLSPLILFDDLDQAGSGGNLQLHFGNCIPPAATTMCERDPDQQLQTAVYVNSATGTCAGAFDGTTLPYSPPVTPSTAPCFVTEPQTVTFDILGLHLDLEAAQIAGTYSGEPADRLLNGLILGFMSEAVAEATIMPDSLPIIGGQPLAQSLPGHATACAPHDDRDLGADGQTLGWWFYMNFVASEVPYTDATGIDVQDAPPTTLAFRPAAPNPFNPLTTLDYTLAISGRVELTVYDAFGRRVATLVDGTQAAGRHQLAWEAVDAHGMPLPSGVYVGRLRAGGSELVQKLVLTK